MPNCSSLKYKCQHKLSFHHWPASSYIPLYRLLVWHSKTQSIFPNLCKFTNWKCLPRFYYKTYTQIFTLYVSTLLSIGKLLLPAKKCAYLLWSPNLYKLFMINWLTKVFPLPDIPWKLKAKAFLGLECSLIWAFKALTTILYARCWPNRCSCKDVSNTITKQTQNTFL